MNTLRSKKLLLIVVILALTTALLIIYTLLISRPGSQAVITHAGTAVETIDLSAEDETRSFTVSTPDRSGENTIEVESGRIRIAHANCADGVCVDTGWISSAGTPIVCLPHNLTISIEGGEESEIDATSR